MEITSNMKKHWQLIAKHLIIEERDTLKVGAEEEAYGQFPIKADYYLDTNKGTVAVAKKKGYNAIVSQSSSEIIYKDKKFDTIINILDINKFDDYEAILKEYARLMDIESLLFIVVKLRYFNTKKEEETGENIFDKTLFVRTLMKYMNIEKILPYVGEDNEDDFLIGYVCNKKIPDDEFQEYKTEYTKKEIKKKEDNIKFYNDKKKEWEDSGKTKWK